MKITTRPADILWSVVKNENTLILTFDTGEMRFQDPDILQPGRAEIDVLPLWRGQNTRAAVIESLEKRITVLWIPNAPPITIEEPIPHPFTFHTLYTQEQIASIAKSRPTTNPGFGGLTTYSVVDTDGNQYDFTGASSSTLELIAINDQRAE